LNIDTYEIRIHSLFFSSRRRHTSFSRDWSSDVCSSDLLAAVRGAQHHPDARWVYDEVSRKIPNISLGTVYRVLASLSAEGLIREVPQAGGPSLYDGNTEEHLHIRCTRCGRLEDIPLVPFPDEWMESVRQLSAFARVDRVRMEFSGVCASCAQQPDAPSQETP